LYKKVNKKTGNYLNSVLKKPIFDLYYILITEKKSFTEHFH